MGSSRFFAVSLWPGAFGDAVRPLKDRPLLLLVRVADDFVHELMRFGLKCCVHVVDLVAGVIDERWLRCVARLHIDVITRHILRLILLAASAIQCLSLRLIAEQRGCEVLLRRFERGRLDFDLRRHDHRAGVELHRSHDSLVASGNTRWPAGRRSNTSVVQVFAVGLVRRPNWPDSDAFDLAVVVAFAEFSGNELCWRWWRWNSSSLLVDGRFHWIRERLKFLFLLRPVKRDDATCLRDVHNAMTFLGRLLHVHRVWRFMSNGVVHWLSSDCGVISRRVLRTGRVVITFRLIWLLTRVFQIIVDRAFRGCDWSGLEHFRLMDLHLFNRLKLGARWRAGRLH